MGVIISLRERENLSWFKRFVFLILNHGGIDEVFICSGYFQEKHMKFHPEYEATKEEHFGKTLAKKLSEIKTVTLVGAKAKADTSDEFSKAWFESYKNFHNALKAERDSKSGLSAYIDKNGNWHAKEFIALKNGKVVAGVIGSSNFTRLAFGENQGYFNEEADVMLYDSSLDKEVDIWHKDFVEPMQDPFLLKIPSSRSRKSDVINLQQQYNKIKKLLQEANLEPLK